MNFSRALGVCRNVRNEFSKGTESADDDSAFGLLRLRITLTRIQKNVVIIRILFHMFDRSTLTEL